MTLSIMLTVLVIDTEYSYSLVKINHIQAIEMVDHSDGGILTVTLKGDKSKFSPTSEDQLKRLANLHLFFLQTKNSNMQEFSFSDRENEDALLELLVSSEEVQSVTKKILDHRKKLISEYISEVIKPVDK